MFKVRTRKDELARAVNQCYSVIPKHSTMDIIMKLLLSAEENKLVLSATDLEVTIQTSIPAEVSGSGQVAIKPKAFFDSLRQAPSSATDIIMDLGENFTLKTICGGFKNSYFGVSSEHFPKVARPEDSEYIKLDARALLDAIDKTSKSVTSGDELYNLKGVYFTREEEEDEPKRLRLVSTDAQRLSVATVEAENLDVFPEVGGILVPPSGLQKLRTLCEPQVDISLSLFENCLVAKTDDSLLKIRLLSGNFPDYRGIIPRDLELQVWVNRKELLDTVKRICIPTDDNYYLANFAFNQDLLTITAVNPEVGEAQDTVGIDYTGQQVLTRFNPNFYVDVLSALKSERVSLQFTPGNASYLMTGPEDPGYMGVIVSMIYDEP
jgi:DNA polymerase-3 subunit beta